MAKKLPYYSNTPAVPTKTMSDSNPYGTPRMGSFTPTSVPKKPAKIGALVQPFKLKTKGHRIGKR